MRSIFFALLSLAVLLTGPGARSDVPNGSYTVDFSGAQSLWRPDVIDACQLGFAGGITLEICLDFLLVSDGAGGVSGSGSVTLELSGGLVAMSTFNGTIVGKVKGSDVKGTKQTLAFKLSGPVAINPITLDVTISGKVVTEITSSGIATTTGTLTTAISGVSTEKSDLPATVEQLPSGDWSAALNITPDAENKTLAGTLDLMLPTGTMQIPLQGKYNAKKDSTSFKAKGDKGNPSQKGISFALKNAVLTGAGSLSGEAKAKVKGLKVSADVATP